MKKTPEANMFLSEKKKEDLRTQIEEKLRKVSEDITYWSFLKNLTLKLHSESNPDPLAILGRIITKIQTQKNVHDPVLADLLTLTECLFLEYEAQDKLIDTIELKHQR